MGDKLLAYYVPNANHAHRLDYAVAAFVGVGAVAFLNDKVRDTRRARRLVHSAFGRLLELAQALLWAHCPASDDDNDLNEVETPGWPVGTSVIE